MLVKDRDFWYIARLIHRVSKVKWLVRWWYGNQVGELGNHTPGTYDTVPTSQIVDSLVGDVKGRRAVRVRIYTACYTFD